MISKNSIETLKINLDIVDIISNNLQLKKSGANFKACCPFHGEDTPSFVVSPVKQIYHCFGCGVGGDAIKFTMEYEKLSYPEAIEKLALITNFTLEYDDKNHKKTDFSLIKKVNEYYENLLVQDKESMDYLINKRGLKLETIKKFEIGYAPKSSETINFLKSNFFNINDAKQFGIVNDGASGMYARFSQRITFPIYSSNNMVGFGGRTTVNHDAKYINSPQTPFFNKSKILYGFNIAKESIYKKQRVIITEGYLDAVMLNQAGFDESVATLGTALTAEHLPLLKKLNSAVILAYDGDNAGLNAAYKASMMLAKSDFSGGVVIFQNGQDPADMVQNNEIDTLKAMFDDTQDFVHYIIETIMKKYDLSVPLNKQNAFNEMQDYIKTLSPIVADGYMTYVTQKLQISNKLVKPIDTRQSGNAKTFLHGIDIAELNIIKTLIIKPEYLEYVQNQLTSNMLKTHKKEFDIVQANPNDEALHFILLNDDIKEYTYDELKQQLYVFTITYYNELQSKAMNSKMSFREKSKQIRDARDMIKKIKRR